MPEIRLCIAPGCTSDLVNRRRPLCTECFSQLPQNLKQIGKFRTFTVWNDTVRDHFHLPPPERPLYRKGSRHSQRFVAKRRSRRA